MKYRTDHQIKIDALKSELKRLEKLHAAAEKKWDEHNHAFSRICELREKANEIVRSALTDAEKAKKIGDLAKEEERLLALGKLDSIKLIDKADYLKIEVESVKRIISEMEFFDALRSGTNK